MLLDGLTRLAAAGGCFPVGSMVIGLAEVGIPMMPEGGEVAVEGVLIEAVRLRRRGRNTSKTLIVCKLVVCCSYERGPQT